MEKKEIIAELMSEKLGAKISPNLVVKLPDDGCPGHMGVKHWEVFAARCGEFTVFMYEYDNGMIFVNII